MKAFRIGTTGWEIYGEKIFVHENKTKTEFNEDCKKAIKKTLKEITNNLENDKSNAILNAYDLMEKSIDNLKEFGYKPLEFEGYYKVPGDDGSYLNNLSKRAKIELGDEFIEFVKKAKIIENKI